jgi:hypothetical protein
MRLVQTQPDARAEMIRLLALDPAWLPSYFIECPHSDVRFVLFFSRKVVLSTCSDDFLKLVFETVRYQSAYSASIASMTISEELLQKIRLSLSKLCGSHTCSVGMLEGVDQTVAVILALFEKVSLALKDRGILHSMQPMGENWSHLEQLLTFFLDFLKIGERQARSRHAIIII